MVGLRSLNTGTESPFANGGDMVGNVNVGQSRAVIERIVANGNKRVGQSQIG